MLLDELHMYSNPKSKLSRLVRSGECIRITKGLYETDHNVPGYLLAGSIYGPSYISFEYALSVHGIIPEAVYTVTNTTFEKKKKKSYTTPFGTFSYRDVPSSAIPFGIELAQDGNYFYRIADPVKALCDKLYTISPVTNANELSELLFNDLRVDEDFLYTLEYDKVTFLATKYHSTNVNKLTTLQIGRAHV